MKIEEYAGIKHIVIKNEVKDEHDLYRELESCVFYKSYRTNTFYPVIFNNKIIFAFKNSQGFIHFYLKNERYRFDRKNRIKYTNTLMFNSDYQRLLEAVREDNTKIFD